MGVRLQVHHDISASERAMREALDKTKESIRLLDEAMLSDNFSESFNDDYIKDLLARRTRLSQVHDQLMQMVVRVGEW